jgi:hypothetical protein
VGDQSYERAIEAQAGLSLIMIKLCKKRKVKSEVREQRRGMQDKLTVFYNI